jgi:hypothetical protein
LSKEYFENESNYFFRPNPTNQNISEQTFIQLKEKLNDEGKKIVIAPVNLWNTLSYQFNLTFHSDTKSFGFILNKEKIEAILSENHFLKTILFRFVDISFAKRVPVYRHQIIWELVNPQQKSEYNERSRSQKTSFPPPNSARPPPMNNLRGYSRK